MSLPGLPLLHQFDSTTDLEIEGRGGLGGFSDVYKGKLRVASQVGLGQEIERRDVAVKQFRVFIDKDKETAKRIEREAHIWRNLKHRNILPLLGYVELGGLPALISDWMDNGSLYDYYKRQATIDVFTMALGIAQGVEYLHNNDVVHSDLRSDNILISSEGIPKISDFGISRLIEESETVMGTTSLKGCVRWMAIELIEPQPEPTSTPETEPEYLQHRRHNFHTKPSDVWAYGMVLYELLTCQRPYYHLISDASVIKVIVSDQHYYPKKPSDEDMEDKNWLWDICTKCWNKSPTARPTMSQVLQRLSDSGSATPSSQSQSIAVNEVPTRPASPSTSETKYAPKRNMQDIIRSYSYTHNQKGWSHR